MSELSRIGQGKGGADHVAIDLLRSGMPNLWSRSLQVSVEYLGRQVVCQHCHGRFEAAATPRSAEQAPSDLLGIDLLRHADRLLGSAGDHDPTASASHRAEWSQRRSRLESSPRVL